MPLYTWLCESCGAKTEVIRSIADIENKPDEGCEVCRGVALKRVIAEWKREQSSMKWGGSAPCHAEAYSKTGRIRET